MKIKKTMSSAEPTAEPTLSELLPADFTESPELLDDLKKKIKTEKEDCHQFMFDMAEYAEWDAVKCLLKAGMDVNSHQYYNSSRDSSSGDALLHIAVKQGDLEIVEFLIGNGAKLDEEDYDGCIPLQTALENDYLFIADALVDAAEEGDYSYVYDNEGNSPLHYAASTDESEVLDGKEIFLTDIVKKILNRMIDEDEEVNATNKNGDTPLHFAVKYGTEELVKQLMAVKGVNVNIPNKKGDTPLHEAGARYNGHRLYTLLLEGGASENVFNVNGYNPKGYQPWYWLPDSEKGLYDNNPYSYPGPM